MKQFSFLVLAFMLFFTSCEKEPTTKFDPSNLLLGTWVSGEYSDTVEVLQRTNVFQDDKPGMQFNDDGTFIRRMNAGWCGTPPVSYENNPGSWNQENDSVLAITCEFWGGIDHYKIQIVSIDKNQLKCTYLFIE